MGSRQSPDSSSETEPQATAPTPDIFETDEELRDTVASYDPMHHTDDLPGSFAAKAAVGGEEEAPSGKPKDSSVLDPGVGPVRWQAGRAGHTC